jgi:hypothetical protein
MAEDSPAQLSSEDLRYLNPKCLEALTNIPANYWRAWGQHRKISENSLARAAHALRLPMEEVLQGLILRREDAAQVKAAEEKARKLLKQQQDCPA